MIDRLIVTAARCETRGVFRTSRRNRPIFVTNEQNGKLYVFIVCGCKNENLTRITENPPFCAKSAKNLLKSFGNKKKAVYLHSGSVEFNGCGRFRRLKNSDMLNYSTSEINRNFKIKVSGILEGRKINTLVGVRGFLAYVGDDELANRLLDRAFDSANDKEICKLRRLWKNSSKF